MMIKLTNVACLVLVILAVVVTTASAATCQLALTTWWSKQKDCDGQSGCASGMMQDGCNRLGDHWVKVDCASKSALVYSSQNCDGMAIGTLLDEECKNAPEPIPLSFRASWDDACSASALFKWTDYLF